MPDQTPNPLTQWSDALAALVAGSAGLMASVRTPHHRPRSGTLWRPDVVIGSEQVFPKADTAEIVVADGRRVAARLAGRDRGTNIVALRLETPIEVAASEAAEPQLGGLAVALGADPGGAPLVRLGIVRALGPAWHSRAGGRIDRRIALDFLVSRGAEGGPVLDAAGRLLGMSTAGPGGRALVIPAATIDRVLDPLLATGRIERGWLGLALHPVTLPDAAKPAAGQDRGLMVMQVAPDGPAGKAGVKEGDVILSLNDHPVRDGNDLIARVADLPVGSTALLTVDRNGKRLDYKAAIEERASVWQKELEGAAEVAPRPELGAIKAPEPKFGITITRVTDTERKELGVMDKIGVRVVSVDPGSFADDIGLTEGDVIVSINRQDVGSPADVLKIQGSLKGGQAVALRVVRTGGARGHKDLQKLWVSGRLPGE